MKLMLRQYIEEQRRHRSGTISRQTANLLTAMASESETRIERKTGLASVTCLSTATDWSWPSGYCSEFALMSGSDSAIGLMSV